MFCATLEVEYAQVLVQFLSFVNVSMWRFWTQFAILYSWIFSHIEIFVRICVPSCCGLVVGPALSDFCFERLALTQGCNHIEPT